MRAHCPHGNERYYCRPCNGGGICQHKCYRHVCKQCGGRSICEHWNQRQACRECNHCVCNIEGCPAQGHRFAGARSLLNHMRAFHSDNAKARTKGKELELYQALQEKGVHFEYQKHIAFAGCGLNGETKHAFLDFAIPQSWGYVVLECDEEAHRHYDPSCDPRRDFDVAAAVALGSEHKLRILRYNPDGFKVDGVSRRVSKAARLERLLAAIQQPEPSGQLERLMLYYDETAGRPDVAKHWTQDVKDVTQLWTSDKCATAPNQA